MNPPLPGSSARTLCELAAGNGTTSFGIVQPGRAPLFPCAVSPCCRSRVGSVALQMRVEHFNTIMHSMHSIGVISAVCCMFVCSIHLLFCCAEKNDRIAAEAAKAAEKKAAPATSGTQHSSHSELRPPHHTPHHTTQRHVRTSGYDRNLPMPIHRGLRRAKYLTRRNACPGCADKATGHVS